LHVPRLRHVDPSSKYVLGGQALENDPGGLATREESKSIVTLEGELKDFRIRS
jgi:hypothetical protein